ncbi:MAG: transglutaminase domain-containing protein [Myxococcales bacterium]|nr:transglutaminase domain-containing protein [Myxococcales bacterium]
MNKPLRWICIFVWLGLLALFAYRQITAQSLPPGLAVAAAAASEDEDRQEWYGIYINQPNGERYKIGYAMTRRSEIATGFRTDADTYMRLAIQGTEQVMRTESKILTDAEYRLQYVDFVMRSDKMKFKVTGQVRGNEIQLEIEAAGATQKQTMALPEVPVMPDDIVSLLSKQGGLKVGNTVELPFFDPMTRRYDKARVRVTQRLEPAAADGRKIVAYRVETEMAGTTAVAIVDEAGNTLEQTMANITMLRETRQAALTENWRDKPADLPEIARVPVDRPIPKPREARRLTVRLAGASLDDLPLGDSRQTFADGVLTVHVPEPPAKGTFKPPLHTDDPEMRALLEPEPLIESDDPAIVAQARQIVPVAIDALTTARVLASWVHDNLEKKPLISITSAKEVLQIRRGDCNEHASLYTALARSLGLPARIDIGLVYVNGAFYYHAWNSVYVGEWVSVDATFGQFPADATHLRIVSGGLDKQVDILRVMGNLKIEVLETP